jgi:hypothetical protein
MGCTRAQRRAGKCPSVNAGCGYRANVSNGKVTIYPTTNNINCEMTLGLGDATFTFDPANPPDTLKRVITADSSGRYTPQIINTPIRSVKLFSSVKTIDESFTDAQGNTTSISLLKLNGFNERGYTSGEYEATGIHNINEVGGKLLDSKSISIFAGAIPYNIKIYAIQLFTFNNGYAYIDAEGYVNVIHNGASKATRFNMGNIASDAFVTEFTIKNDNQTFICKNANGVAVEVFAPFSYGNFFSHRSVTKDVIRVAGGKMLIQAKDGVIEKSILIDGGNAVAIGEDDVVDIMPDGNGGIVEIKISDGKSNIIKRVGQYALTLDNKLLHNDIEIATNIFGIGRFSQHKPEGLMLGKAGSQSNIVMNSAINAFVKAGVKDSWKTAYVNWYASQELPSCEWAGVSENTTTTQSYAFCTKQAATSNSAVPTSILVIDVNGDILRVDGSKLIKQITVDKDANGFNVININDNSGKFITFNTDDGFRKFSFAITETNNTVDNYIFRHQ